MQYETLGVSVCCFSRDLCSPVIFCNIYMLIAHAALEPTLLMAVDFVCFLVRSRPLLVVLL
jgi:hypothetical protein